MHQNPKSQQEKRESRKRFSKPENTPKPPKFEPKYQQVSVSLLNNKIGHWSFGWTITKLSYKPSATARVSERSKRDHAT